jgi:hypothetical protein
MEHDAVATVLIALYIDKILKGAKPAARGAGV